VDRARRALRMRRVRRMHRMIRLLLLLRLLHAALRGQQRRGSPLASVSSAEGTTRARFASHPGAERRFAPSTRAAVTAVALAEGHATLDRRPCVRVQEQRVPRPTPQGEPAMATRGRVPGAIAPPLCATSHLIAKGLESQFGACHQIWGLSSVASCYESFCPLPTALARDR
jgi:hypothetical protein